MKPLSLLLPLLLATAAAAQQSGYVVITIAGVPGVAGLQDGDAHGALFNRPTWLDYDSEMNTIYVVDRANQRLRRVANGNVASMNVMTRLDQDPKPVPFDFGGPFGGGIAVEPPTAGCGGGPWDKGMFVSSTAAQQIVFIADAYGTFPLLTLRDNSSPFLGIASTPGNRDGGPAVAQFNNPGDVALSWNYRGNYTDVAHDQVYIADAANHAVRRVRFRLGFEGCPEVFSVDSLARGFDTPRGIAAAPDGSIYVADSGDHTIRRILPGGQVTTVAGLAGVPGSSDGFGPAARLNTPSGLDVDAEGNVYIADTGNHIIRKLTPDGVLRTIAGAAGQPGYADGPAESARFNGPVGVRLAGGTLYIADTSNQVIRAYALPGNSRRRRTVR